MTHKDFKVGSTMRLAVAGLWHETNTFSSVRADYAAFEADALLRGEAIWEEYRNSQATIAGFLEAAQERRFEAIPLLHARTGPIGVITDDAFERIVGEIISRLEADGPWDGVLLANHGAAVAAGFPDADGEMVARVRAAVGTSTPIGLALDLHANVSRRMVRHSSVMNTYQTNPHLDAKARGHEVATLIARTISGEIAPVQWLEQPPLVINITRQWTGESPMQEIIARAARTNAQPGILSASAIQGYPYADVAEMGMSFHVVADRDVDLARRAAEAMAGHAWSLRNEMLPRIPNPGAALRRAAQISREASRPVVIMDVGDNILGGSAADSTVLLAEARALGIGQLLQTVFDPESVERCKLAGVGANVTLSIGATTDTHHGDPLPLEATVKRIADGKYEDSTPTHGGFRYFDDGERALIEARDGTTILLTSRRSSNLSREQWYSIGIRPENYPIVIAKGVVSPRPAYEPIASAVLLANTPGLTTADLDTLDYRRRRRPLFPLELDAIYPDP